jgi:hypothetical protein
MPVLHCLPSFPNVTREVEIALGNAAIVHHSMWNSPDGVPTPGAFELRVDSKPT